MDDQLDTVLLLKHGKPVRYGRCTVCDRFTQARSDRGWCPGCEVEFKKMKRAPSPEPNPKRGSPPFPEVEAAGGGGNSPDVSNALSAGGSRADENG